MARKRHSDEDVLKIFQEIDRRFCVEVDGEEVPAIPGIYFGYVEYEFAQANEKSYSSGLDNEM
jgi:hypothetical protein